VGARRYELTVEGELSDEAAIAFHGMSVARRQGTTTLVGEVRDQAELQGLLSRVSSLGLTLLSANALDDTSST